MANNPGICNFECVRECAGKCCGGATMITIDEIANLYDLFPITIGFRKYAPVEALHEAFLEAAGIRAGGAFIIGDFIAGNWRKPRCPQLGRDNLCGLQSAGKKPSQCSLVPFCAVYPEEVQDAILYSQREGAFRHCKGYKPLHETENAVWKKGRFVDPSYGEAFRRYRSGLMRQRPFMQKILDQLKRQDVFPKFLRGSGMLEVAIPGNMLVELLASAGLTGEKMRDFADRQSELCLSEIRNPETKAPVFGDALAMLKQFLKGEGSQA